MHDRNYSRALSVITREQYSFVSHEPNTRVKRKIPRGTNRYSRFFVNLDVSCTVTYVTVSCFSNMIYHETIKVSSTTTAAFLSKIFCANYPATLEKGFWMASTIMKWRLKIFERQNFHCSMPQVQDTTMPWQKLVIINANKCNSSYFELFVGMDTTYKL